MPTSRPVPQQHWERILITARTYPAPSTKDIEVSCTAGITSDGEWIRLFPVPYRFLESDKRFAKYQEIECLIHKAKTDSRPESHRVNVESIKILSERLSTADRWAERRRRVEPLEAHCMCCVQKRQQQYGSPTLGFIKPAEIIKLSIEPTRAEWTEAEIAKLRQHSLWEKTPVQELEKIPFVFKYHWRCPHSECNGHAQSCTDWEMAQAYRAWRDKYRGDWEGKFRQRFEDEMMNDRDTRFFVGTVNNHPNSWLIVGLWYPPRANSGDEAQQPTLL